MIGLKSHSSRILRHFPQQTPRAGRPYIVSLFEHQEFF
jgi:hypothetical protein